MINSHRWLAGFEPMVHISKSGLLGKVTKWNEKIGTTAWRAAGKGALYFKVIHSEGLRGILFLGWGTWACYLSSLSLSFLIFISIIAPKVHMCELVLKHGEAQHKVQVILRKAKHSIQPVGTEDKINQLRSHFTAQESKPWAKQKPNQNKGNKFSDEP